MIVSNEMFYVVEKHTDDTGVWLDFGFACGSCACTLRGFLLCVGDADNNAVNPVDVETLSFLLWDGTGRADVRFREEDLRRGLDQLTAVMPRRERPEKLVWDWSDAYPEDLTAEGLNDMLVEAMQLDPWEQGRWSLWHDVGIARLIRLSGIPEGWQHNAVRAYWEEHNDMLRRNKERLTDAVLRAGRKHKAAHSDTVAVTEVYSGFVPHRSTLDSYGNEEEEN